MLEELIERMLESKEADKKMEEVKAKAGVAEVEQLFEELYEKYPNMRSIRKMIFHKMKEIPEIISECSSTAMLFEPSQQVALLGYIAALLKCSVIQVEDIRSEILEPKTEETSSAEPKA